VNYSDGFRLSLVYIMSGIKINVPKHLPRSVS
jgi:hypothetical protein